MTDYIERVFRRAHFPAIGFLLGGIVCLAEGGPEKSPPQVVGPLLLVVGFLLLFFAFVDWMDRSERAEWERRE